MNFKLKNLLFILDSSLVEVQLLDVKEYKHFKISSIRCLIKNEDLSLNNQYFITIEDSKGVYCVDWIIALDFVEERLIYWRRFLELGHRQIVEYSFPNIFPVRSVILDGDKNGNFN